MPYLLYYSYNSIETLKGLDQFGRLEELILDNNKLNDAISFPYLASLKTLSLNNNEVCFRLVNMLYLIKINTATFFYDLLRISIPIKLVVVSMEEKVKKDS